MTDSISDYLTRVRNAIKANHRIVEVPRTLERVSSPGLRKYSGATTMPRVLNGLGIAIVSTSKGVITDKEAKKMNVGGEILCYIS
ncbi:MAG: rpsH [Bacteroidetes bacterium]|nr:rpsH [Bacteroidota bacterium]